MYALRPLGPEHEQAVLAFEVENRDYFRGFVADRGDDYFVHYSQRHRALLIEQAAGVCAFHVLVDEAGSVVGRFNLYDLADGSAEVGYRVAGSGVATSAVLEGDPVLSIRDDEAEESWRIVEPILEVWASGDVPMVEYAAGSSGPAESRCLADRPDRASYTGDGASRA